MSTLPNSGGRAPRRRRLDKRRKDAGRFRLGIAPLQETISQRLPELHWPRIALTVVTILVLSALLSLHLLPDRVSLHVGDRSGHEIRAVRAARYVDEDATNSLRMAAAARVDPIYVPVPYASSEAAQTIHDSYERLRRDRVLANQDASRAASELREEVGVAISPPALLEPLLDDVASPYHLDQAERMTAQVVHEVMSDQIRDNHPEDLSKARAAVAARLTASMLPQAYIPGVVALARAVVRPNQHLDSQRTESKRQAEAHLVGPVYGQVFTGDIVVRQGEIVTPSIVSKFRALGLQNPRLELGMVLSVTLLTAFMVGIVLLYLYRYHAAVYQSTKLLILLSILVALSIFGLKLGGSMLGVRLSAAQFGYIGMLCVAAAGMLIASLINSRIAMLVAALLAAQTGFILGNDLRFTVMTLLSSFVAIYMVSDLRSRSDVLKAGAALCAANILLSALVGRIEGDTQNDLTQSALWAFGSGFFAVALFWLAAALFERLFGITTHLGLLELSDPNHPLLRRFCEVAPGTYTHSVKVGVLAVSAAEAIGADALLCRVGAYYHDLGKMRSAGFFIENQSGGENVHETLNPSLSALVVRSHVKDGLEIADEEHLPPLIKAFITEHHGTSLIKYFYHQQTAGEAGEAAPGLEQHFRYGGPKPQSRETAILMLADGVEAASQTLEKPTPGRIADLVDKIINAQVADGQMDECDLTLRDLHGIRDAFVRLLSGMLHSRIPYPLDLKEAALKASELKQKLHEPADQPSDVLVSGTRH